MLRSTVLLRHVARLAVLLPLAAACGSESRAARDGAPSEAGATVDASDSGDGSDRGDGGDGGAEASADVTPPTVISSYPLDGEKRGATNATMSATFSEPMAPQTLTKMTFRVKQGAVEIPGVVAYFDSTATFSPTSALALDTTYTAMITTGATDLAGNALAAAYTWTFTTDSVAPLGPPPVALGAAVKYAILSKAGITNVPTSMITGDLGVSPAAAGSITGFALVKAGVKWTSPQVIGGVFAADNDPPTPSNLTTAVSNMEAAYVDAAGRAGPTTLNVGGGAIGGLTLVPGLYTWDTAVTIPSNLTISGAPGDVWIFQIAGTLTMTAAQSMTLIGGAHARNIFWQVAGAVDLGAMAHVEGIVISKTAITLGTGASVNGRLFAQTAVTLAGNVITAPAP